MGPDVYDIGLDEAAETLPPTPEEVQADERVMLATWRRLLPERRRRVAEFLADQARLDDLERFGV